MKLDIKLKDPKYCNGCPCLRFWDEKEVYCYLGYPDYKNPLGMGANKPLDLFICRLQKCIEENGE